MQSLSLPSQAFSPKARFPLRPAAVTVRVRGGGGGGGGGDGGGGGGGSGGSNGVCDFACN